MTTTIRLEGSAELQSALKRASAEIRAAVSKEVMATAQDLRADVVRTLRQPGKGVTYQKRNPTRTHTASAGGDPPATDTGRLRNSIMFEKLGDLTAAVKTDVEYGTYLEYGTINMAARPFLRPAVERIRPQYIGRLEQVLKGALK